MTILLKGMTWSHPRGYDPLVAGAEIWKQKTGIEISWEKRSLQDFESYPVAELARIYDLIVIDHPHVGQVTEEGCLAPLDIAAYQAEADLLQQQSVGGSFESYHWQGRQWALPIDAATQVMAWRPDLLSSPPREWRQVLELARDGHVLLPLRPPHSLMVFMTLCAHLGAPCGGERLVDQTIGTQSLEMMAEITSLLGAREFHYGSDSGIGRARCRSEPLLRVALFVRLCQLRHSGLSRPHFALRKHSCRRQQFAGWRYARRNRHCRFCIFGPQPRSHGSCLLAGKRGGTAGHLCHVGRAACQFRRLERRRNKPGKLQLLSRHSANAGRIVYPSSVLRLHDAFSRRPPRD